MPFDAASPPAGRPVTLSVLLNSGLPAFAGGAGGASPPATDTVTAMRAVTASVLVDEHLKPLVVGVPPCRSALEVATFFIGLKYSALKGATGVLGGATSAVSVCPDGMGFFQHFQNGSIYWHPATGAHEVRGDIRAKWASLGWERGVLGYPVSDEMAGRDAAGAGRVSRFQYGTILWYPPPAALAAPSDEARAGGKTIPGPKVPSTVHEVHGAIAAKYRWLGAEDGFLGYPTTDESVTPDGFGRYNHFQGGSIYWTPGTGASSVRGGIRDYWAAHGWERNPDLGYPITDESIPDRRIRHARPDPTPAQSVAPPVDRARLPVARLSSSVLASGALGAVSVTGSERPFPGGPFSTAAPAPSPNRFSDFENGVVFWRRGDTFVQPLAPWSVTKDGTRMRLAADDVIRATQPRIEQALGALSGIALQPITFVGTTGYTFDGVGVHNRRHRLLLTFTGRRSVGPVAVPVQAAFEVQVEVAFEPLERIVRGQIVDWYPSSVPGDQAVLSRQVHTALDPTLWSGFTLLPLPDTNAGAPMAVLSVKTMGNGDVNLYIEP